MLLKIINVPPSSSYLRIDSGQGYDFLWDDKHQGFIYAPKTQKEIEEIYQALAAYGNSWVVVPVLGAAALSATKPDGEPGVSLVAPSTAPAPISADERAEQAAYVAKLQSDLDSAAGIITGLRKQLDDAGTTIANLQRDAADKDGTIAMLRADLAAQQQKAVAVATPPPAKGKPGRKPRPAPFGTDDATPDTDLPADV